VHLNYKPAVIIHSYTWATNASITILFLNHTKLHGIVPNSIGTTYLIPDDVWNVYFLIRAHSVVGSFEVRRSTILRVIVVDVYIILQWLHSIEPKASVNTKQYMYSTNFEIDNFVYGLIEVPTHNNNKINNHIIV